MTQETEQKHLPASDKKLRDAHQRGQVSQSKDLVSAFVMTAALVYIYFAGPAALGRIIDLIDLVARSLDQDSAQFGETARDAINKAALAALMITAPLVAIVFFATTIFGMIATRGLVFSLETIKPKMEHINPIEGFKKIASRRNLIEFVKGLAKMVILALVLATVLMAWLQPLFVTPGCGPSCIQPTLVSMLIPLGAAMALAFIAIGILDVPIQRWLFLQDMRMTTTEYKREQKDMEGDPLIRQALQRQRREAAIAPKVGLRRAVMVLRSGQVAIGLRYVAGETPIPAVVAKGRGGIAKEMILQAQEAGIPVVEDGELAEELYRTARTADYIGESFFSRVGRHLVKLGKI